MLFPKPFFKQPDGRMLLQNSNKSLNKTHRLVYHIIKREPDASDSLRLSPQTSAAFLYYIITQHTLCQ